MTLYCHNVPLIPTFNGTRLVVYGRDGFEQWEQW